MGVTASSSSSPAGLRNGVRSLPSVAVSVPVAVAGLELRGVFELVVVGPAIAPEARGAERGGDLRRTPGSATIHDHFWSLAVSAKRRLRGRSCPVARGGACARSASPSRCAPAVPPAGPSVKSCTLPNDHPYYCEQSSLSRHQIPRPPLLTYLLTARTPAGRSCSRRSTTAVCARVPLLRRRSRGYSEVPFV